MRKLEEAREAERRAAELREHRRERREEGLPELTRSERLRERFSGSAGGTGGGMGRRLGEPRYLVAIFAVGVLAQQLHRWAVRDVRRQVYAAQPASAPARVGYALLALLLDLIGIMVFAATTVAAFFVPNPSPVKAST